MEMPDTMTTLSQVLEVLRSKKMDTEFRFSGQGFVTDSKKLYMPGQLVIIQTYRFEGMSNPSDMSILYLIKANDGVIGYSIDAYGTYSNHEYEYYEAIRHIPVMRQ